MAKKTKDASNKKSPRPTNVYDEESETEIVTEIIISSDGGWGWVVLAAGFTNIFVTDGIFFTFGTIYKDISEDLQVKDTIVALINSVCIAVYFISSPIASAFINRFGFRVCAMTGSIIVSTAFTASYFVHNFPQLVLTYGVLAGFGGCFINMSSQLVVGFYFERLRALAMSLAGLGTSAGITIMYAVNAALVKLAGWRITTLLHAGLIGTVFFITMAFRPLVSLSVVQEIDGGPTLTYLPSASTVAFKPSRVQLKETRPEATRAEKLFSAVSNARFPTAAEMIEESVTNVRRKDEAGTSSATVSKIALSPRVPRGGMSQRQLKQVQSYVSRSNLGDRVAINNEPEKKLSWWRRCCHWEPHVNETRPMYRDDVFYNGTVANLAAYDKNVAKANESKYGFEYQMAVSRAAAVSDLEERKGIFTTAIRRVLATMLDTQLLSRTSFFLVCISSFLLCVGIYVPLLFWPDRNSGEGIAENHCHNFVSVIGFSNTIGRLVAGFLACKYKPIKMYASGAIIGGGALIISNFSFDLYYQYFCCVLYGYATAHVTGLRGPLLVELFGLEKLTNTTGMILMFSGFGVLLSTPIAGLVKDNFGFNVSFHTAGSCIVLSGLIILTVKRISLKEERKNTPLVKKHSSIINRKRKSKLRKLSSILEME